MFDNFSTLVTLTGADETTSIERLIALSKGRPFVEWGFLLSPAEAGRHRFPSLGKIGEIAAKLSRAAIFCALHVCGGDAVQRFIDRDPDLIALADGYRRIQLNFNVREHAFDLAALDRAISRWPTPVITQHNPANKEVWQKLSAPNHQVLFDASSGRGISPPSWPAPLGDKICGYAGGIGPDNIARVLREVARAAMGRKWWIDMEAKLRKPANDAFDLDRCGRVLVAVDDFLKSA